MKLLHTAKRSRVQTASLTSMHHCLPPSYCSPHLPSPLFFVQQLDLKTWPQRSHHGNLGGHANCVARQWIFEDKHDVALLLSCGGEK